MTLSATPPEAMTLTPSFSPLTRPTRLWPGSEWKTAVTSAPFSVTGGAAASSALTCTSTSPPLTRSGREESVAMPVTPAPAATP